MATKTDIALVKSLAKKQAREEQGLFVVEGPKMVEEALASNFRVVRLFGVEKFARLPNVEITAKRGLERMSNLRAPQGVLALIEKPDWRLPKPTGKGVRLVIDGVQDPGNLGTIIRIADWFGIEDVVCSPTSADCFSPKVVQATMGAIYRVKIHYTELEPFLRSAADEQFPVFGTFLEGEQIYEATLPNDALIVMGSEGEGVSREIEALISHRLHIPPYPPNKPTSESLNVAVATAIVCSEFRRRG